MAECEPSYTGFLAGIDVIEVWGMTETTGTATTNTPEVFRTGSVGKPVPGMNFVWRRTGRF